MRTLRKILPVAAGLLVGAVLVPPGIAVAKAAVQEVLVTNTSAQPVPVAGTVDVADDREPFETRLDMNMANGTFSDSDSFQVPAGKRLVVEFVSAHFSVPPGQTPTVALNASGGALGFSVPLSEHGVQNGSSGASNQWTGALTVLDFAGPGDTYQALAYRQESGPGIGAPGNASAFVYISGYLLPA